MVPSLCALRHVTRECWHEWVAEEGRCGESAELCIHSTSSEARNKQLRVLIETMQHLLMHLLKHFLMQTMLLCTPICKLVIVPVQESERQPASLTHIGQNQQDAHSSIGDDATGQSVTSGSWSV